MPPLPPSAWLFEKVLDSMSSMLEILPVMVQFSRRIAGMLVSETIRKKCDQPIPITSGILATC
jgi:hypothetical protein